jgi:hypothetical protein
MHINEILKFLEENKDNDIKDLYDKTHDKLQELNSRIDRSTVIMLLVTLVYFLVSGSSIESFSLGPFTIKDLNVLTQLMPVIFAYLVFDIVITSNHKGDAIMLNKTIFKIMYKQEITDKELKNYKNVHDSFTRIVLPFSFTTELSRLFSGKTPILVGCIGILLALPVLSIYLLPFCLEFYMLKQLYVFHSTNLIGKICFYSAIYISLITLFYFVKVMINNYHEIKSNRGV